MNGNQSRKDSSRLDNYSYIVGIRKSGLEITKFFIESNLYQGAIPSGQMIWVSQRLITFIMKTEIKEKLVAELQSRGDRTIGGSYPVIHVLAKILQTMHEGVDFTTLDNVQARKDQKKGAPALRGDGWGNILMYSELKRFDFYVDINEITVTTEDGGTKTVLLPKYARSYKYNTIGSIIHSLPRSHKTYEYIAELIQEHYVA